MLAAVSHPSFGAGGFKIGLSVDNLVTQECDVSSSRDNVFFPDRTTMSSDSCGRNRHSAVHTAFVFCHSFSRICTFDIRCLGGDSRLHDQPPSHKTLNPAASRTAGTREGRTSTLRGNAGNACRVQPCRRLVSVCPAFLGEALGAFCHGRPTRSPYRPTDRAVSQSKPLARPKTPLLEFRPGLVESLLRDTGRGAEARRGGKNVWNAFPWEKGGELPLRRESAGGYP